MYDLLRYMQKCTLAIKRRENQHLLNKITKNSDGIKMFSPLLSSWGKNEYYKNGGMKTLALLPIIL